MSGRQKTAIAAHNAGSATTALNPIGSLMGFGAILAFLVCYLVFDARPAIAWAIVTIAAPGAVAVRRFREEGLLDALGIFCFVFVAYDGVLLLRLATMNDLTATPYPWPFTQEVYTQTGILGAVAAITIFLTSVLVERISPARRRADQVGTDARDSNWSAWFHAGLIMYLVGLVLYFLQYQQIGGYLAGLKAGRGNRFDQFREAGLSWPYMAFLLPGLASIWYSSELDGTRGKKWTARFTLTLWCGLLLVQGDRLPILQAVMTVVAVCFSAKGRKLRMRLRLGVLFAVAYLALAAFGYLRVIIGPIVRNEMTQADTESFVETNPLFDEVKPENSELAGPYLSLLAVVNQQTGDILSRNSYVESLLSVIPKVLYPGTKPIYLSERFANVIHAGNGPVSGWGFNPVAEAYLNFGTGGVVLVFMLWTLTFSALSALKYWHPMGTLIYAVLLSEAIDANRIDFRNIYSIAFYFIGGVLLMRLLTRILEEIG
jgi:hypothetical protein